MPVTITQDQTLSEQDLQSQRELDNAFCSAMTRKDLAAVLVDTSIIDSMVQPGKLMRLVGSWTRSVIS